MSTIATSNPMSIMPSLLWYVGMALRMKTTILQSVLVDMKPAMAAKGSTIDTVFSYDMEVTDVVPSENNPAFQNPEFRQTTLVLDNWKNVKFRYDNDFLSGGGIYGQFIPNSILTATISLIDYVNNVVAGGLRTTPSIIVGTGIPLGVYSDLVSLNELISANAPSIYRSALFGRKTEGSLLNQAQFTTADYNSGPSAVRQGVLPNTLGYDLIPYQDTKNCSDAPQVNEISGDIAFTLPTDMKGFVDYQVVATVTTGHDGKSFYPGNVLILQDGSGDKDNTTSLVITKKATVSGTSATITVCPSDCYKLLSTGGATTAKMLNVVNDAFAYQKFGVGLASRPSSHPGLGYTNVHIDDVVNQFSYGLRHIEGYYTMLLSLDSLFGTALLMKDYVARAIQVPSSDAFVPVP